MKTVILCLFLAAVAFGWLAAYFNSPPYKFPPVLDWLSVIGSGVMGFLGVAMLSAVATDYFLSR